MYRLARVLSVLVVVGCSVAVQGAEPPRVCETHLRKTTSNRWLPHAFFDQTVESLNSLYPDHIVLVSRRVGRLGNIRYSLIVYKVEPTSDRVHIDAMAVDHSDAWVYTADCPADEAMGGLVETLEAVSHPGG